MLSGIVSGDAYDGATALGCHPEYRIVVEPPITTEPDDAGRTVSPPCRWLG